MKFFVTGANGYIGSYLCQYLLKNNHQVIAHSRAFLPDVKKLLTGAEFLEGDILGAEFPALSVQADVMIHLAASNDIVSKNMAKGIELSACGTANALKLAVTNNIPKFIFYSTLQVYGTELKGEYNESSPVRPENDYAMNHLFGEMYTEMFARKHDLKTLIIRPSNIYGRFLSPQINRWTLVPGCLCKEAVEKGTITLLSSGKQYRNFISLEELSHITLQASINMNQKYEILNAVSNDYQTIVDVARLTQQILKSDFNRDVELIIKSELPAESNHFQFVGTSELALKTEGFSHKDFNLISEIREVIRMLLA